MGLFSKKSTSNTTQDNRRIYDNSGEMSGNSGTILIENVTDDVLGQFVNVTQEAFSAVESSNRNLSDGYTESLRILTEDRAGVAGFSKLLIPVAVVAGIAML